MADYDFCIVGAGLFGAVFACEAAKAGTWNISAAHVIIDKDLQYDSANEAFSTVTSNLEYKVSNKVIGETLADTNVDIVAKPQVSSYYSDIRVNAAIEKTGGTDTSLTMTAGRNITVGGET